MGIRKAALMLSGGLDSSALAEIADLSLTFRYNDLKSVEDLFAQYQSTVRSIPCCRPTLGYHWNVLLASEISAQVAFMSVL